MRTQKNESVLCFFTYPNSRKLPAASITHGEYQSLMLLERCLYYKGIYILNNGINLVFGEIFLPFVKVVAILGFVTSSVAVLRMSSQMNILSFGFTVDLGLVCVIGLIPISMAMSSLFDMSLEFHENMKDVLVLRQVQCGKTKLCLEMELKSCPLICCRIGNFYHMEGEHPNIGDNSYLHQTVALV
jgi:hypothetical protein